MKESAIRNLAKKIQEKKTGIYYVAEMKEDDPEKIARLAKQVVVGIFVECGDIIRIRVCAPELWTEGIDEDEYFNRIIEVFGELNDAKDDIYADEGGDVYFKDAIKFLSQALNSESTIRKLVPIIMDFHIIDRRLTTDDGKIVVMKAEEEK